MRLIFAGTPEFAAQALTALINSEHEIIAVYTQPDRPAGRGRKLTASPVKQTALAANIPVYQPESLKSETAQAELRALEPEAIVVAAYGLLLPKAVLDIPPLGCLNIHASLLPRWRGAAPIQRAILAGDTQTGITIMQMDVGLDTGEMLYKLSCDINCDSNAATLHNQLATLGAQAIVYSLNHLDELQQHAEKQDEPLATYAKKLQKSEANIDWQASAKHISRQVNAFNPWPVAQTLFGDKVLRIWQAQVLDETSKHVPGYVIRATKLGVDVATGDGVLRLLSLQLPGGKAQGAAQFIHAHSLEHTHLG
ncbi:MAG: methionyl-tRNA formyltransferase [Gammaproteobacteria bacterium]|nr:methionyl-tRNA formyltransferase [Gammaproteobacteria bacterium]